MLESDCFVFIILTQWLDHYSHFDTDLLAHQQPKRSESQSGIGIENIETRVCWMLQRILGLETPRNEFSTNDAPMRLFVSGDRERERGKDRKVHFALHTFTPNFRHFSHCVKFLSSF